jgi:hypothetical protein
MLKPILHFSWDEHPLANLLGDAHPERWHGHVWSRFLSPKNSSTKIRWVWPETKIAKMIKENQVKPATWGPNSTDMVVLSLACHKFFKSPRILGWLPRGFFYRWMSNPAESQRCPTNHLSKSLPCGPWLADGPTVFICVYERRSSKSFIWMWVTSSP